VSQVVAHRVHRQSPQPIVGAKFEDHDDRPVQLERARQPLEATTAGLAADTGVDDLVPVTLSLQTLREQRHPTLFRPDSVSGAQAVAEYKDGTGRSHRVLERDERQPHA
jgi:hypothetical protein